MSIPRDQATVPGQQGPGVDLHVKLNDRSVPTPA
jgi:hypothetical protein